MTKRILYNPYTRITHLEKLKLVRFLHENAENGHFSDDEVLEAVECAVKERPSFGGFILALQENEELLGALVVTCTGMESVAARHRLMMLAICKEHRNNGVAHNLIGQAIQQAGGDLALNLDPDDGETDYFENLGFQKRFVEMRWHNTGKAA